MRCTPGDIWRQVCWLPQERRLQPEVASHGQVLVIGSNTGAVTILDFSRVQ
jgi:hypothetical protein